MIQAAGAVFFSNIYSNRGSHTNICSHYICVIMLNAVKLSAVAPTIDACNLTSLIAVRIHLQSTQAQT
jgi:hypothetical protein